MPRPAGRHDSAEARARVPPKVVLLRDMITTAVLVGAVATSEAESSGPAWDACVSGFEEFEAAATGVPGYQKAFAKCESIGCCAFNGGNWFNRNSGKMVIGTEDKKVTAVDICKSQTFEDEDTYFGFGGSKIPPYMNKWKVNGLQCTKAAAASFLETRECEGCVTYTSLTQKLYSNLLDPRAVCTPVGKILTEQTALHPTNREKQQAAKRFRCCTKKQRFHENHVHKDCEPNNTTTLTYLVIACTILSIFGIVLYCRPRKPNSKLSGMGCPKCGESMHPFSESTFATQVDQPIWQLHTLNCSICNEALVPGTMRQQSKWPINSCETPDDCEYLMCQKCSESWWEHWRYKQRPAGDLRPKSQDEKDVEQDSQEREQAEKNALAMIEGDADAEAEMAAIVHIPDPNLTTNLYNPFEKHAAGQLVVASPSRNAVMPLDR